MVRIADRFEFGTKAETLERLQGRLSSGMVPPFMRFTVSEWKVDRTTVLEAIGKELQDAGDLIVRSSALSEDGGIYAQAGAFLSVPYVRPNDTDGLQDAVEKTIASYGKSEEASQGRQTDQVIVQEMVRNVSMSGVLFTQDLSSGAPYFVINYDDESGSTDTITAGTGYSNRTIYIYRDAWKEVQSERFRKLLEAVLEIETLTGDGCLDVEFALDAHLNVYILQVRRITTQPNWNRGLGIRIGDALGRLRMGIEEHLSNSDNGKVHRTILGKMPDWNPAEMIGSAPRRLAFSLYRYMITDGAWRRARDRMGYREPRGLPLMWSCAGQPYIDARQSFRSFLPVQLDEALSERIVDHWVERLRTNPQFHDKVEFAVAITTWSFDFAKRSTELLPDELSREEYRAVEEAFRELTVAAVEGHHASISDQEHAVKELQRRHSATVGGGAISPDIAVASRMIEDAIEFGTVPFSVLARHAFIAKTLLDSLVVEAVLDQGTVDSFYRSVPTVASDFISDMERFGRGDISRNALMGKYGHLRPGAYDILSLRYDQRDGAFLSGAGKLEGHGGEAAPEFSLQPHQKAAIEARLGEAGFGIGADDLMEYCTAAIQGREWAKFVFTHSISDSLELIAAWGQRLGLSREELSHLDIRELLDSLVETKGRSLEHHLRTRSEEGRREHDVTSAIRLPYVISQPSDIVIVPMLLDQPNFVTLKSVKAPSVLVSGRDVDPEALDGRIVAIESADPGFDWIFTRPICGLVTKFGGANSHMAIRCAEFDLPAAIGCGEQIFERVVRSGYIELDCAVGHIEPVQH